MHKPRPSSVSFPARGGPARPRGGVPVGCGPCRGCRPADSCATDVCEAQAAGCVVWWSWLWPHGAALAWTSTPPCALGHSCRSRPAHRDLDNQLAGIPGPTPRSVSRRHIGPRMAAGLCPSMTSCVSETLVTDWCSQFTRQIVFLEREVPISRSCRRSSRSQRKCTPRSLWPLQTDPMIFCFMHPSINGQASAFPAAVRLA